MENYLLRISSINLNNNILILKEFNSLHSIELFEKNNFQNDNKKTKQIFLEIAEELESPNIMIRYNSLTKLFFLFVKDPKFNFMLSDKLEENFESYFINFSFNSEILQDLIKNLSFLYNKFIEFNK